MLAVMDGLRSTALALDELAPVVRVLDELLLLPLRLATIPAPALVELVLGLLLLLSADASIRGGSSPILPWCRNSSPPITSNGWLGISALS